MAKFSMKYVLLAAAGSVMIAGLIGMAAFSLWNKQPKLDNFELRYRDASWNLRSDLKDLNLIYSGYVKCPDVCPMTLAFAASAFRKLNQEQLSQVRLFFISVDALHDKPEAVAEYAAQFFPGFVGLTGSPTQIRQATDILGMSFIEEPNPGSHLGYSISHSNRILFLNHSAKVVDSISNPQSADEIFFKLQEHL